MVVASTLAYALKFPGRETPGHAQCLAQFPPRVHLPRGSLQLFGTNR